MKRIRVEIFEENHLGHRSLLCGIEEGWLDGSLADSAFRRALATQITRLLCDEADRAQAGATGRR